MVSLRGGVQRLITETMFGPVQVLDLVGLWVLSAVRGCYVGDSMRCVSPLQREEGCRRCGSGSLIDSGDHSNLTVSDDEHDSDDDRQRSLSENSGPKIEKRMTKEFSRGGVGGISNRSEEEVFSDTVTEFLDTGFGPGNEKVVEGDRGTNQQIKG